ncbi:GMC oxidoreductase [Halocatena halophila]|uniref:GMC oxidoreductase n=1 Tax=Halocatena halophila TaxID=2814576 RepID=UPI002ED3F21C
MKAKASGDIPSLNDGIGKEWGTNGDELFSRTGISESAGSVQGGPANIAAYDFENPIKPTGFMHSPTFAVGESTQLQMGMCIPDQTSTATYNHRTDRIDFNWSRTANKPSHNALLHSMNKMTDASGGSVVDLSATGTWHPLGGATMGVACSYSGEGYGTPNLFVVDGALIPGSAGVANPALTIGANAERIMESVVSQLR